MEAQDRLSAAGLTADHVAPLRDEPPTELRRVPGCRSKRDRQVVLTYDSHRVLDHYKWVTLSGRAVVLQEAWPQTPRGPTTTSLPEDRPTRTTRPAFCFSCGRVAIAAGGRSHRRPVPRRGDDGRGCARIDVRLLRLRHRRVRPGRRSDRAAAGARGARLPPVRAARGRRRVAGGGGGRDGTTPTTSSNSRCESGRSAPGSGTSSSGDTPPSGSRLANGNSPTRSTTSDSKSAR